MAPPLPSAILENIPMASGPGINADEADSMMQSLAFHHSSLARNMLSLLENIKDEEEDIKDVSSVKRDVLIEVAHLVTGRWGPGNSTSAGRTSKNKRFIDRMQELHASLSYLIEQTRQKKPFSISKKSGKKTTNPWIRGADGGRPGGLVICFKAVDYIMREGVFRRTIFKNGRPFGLTWGILAKGNGKLPFMSYSELPMATCPGAGDCAVYSQQTAGWCYSFKAWRYPDAFARQFLNTLANVADEAFAKYRGGMELMQINPKTKKRTRAIDRRYEEEDTSRWDKYLPKGKRIWPDYVKWLLLFQTRTQRGRSDAPVFLRLFVDGDVRNASSVREWMQVCRDMAKGRPATQAYSRKRKSHIEVYGYSKSWHLFTGQQNMQWPRNYALNMSGGSTMWNKPSIRSKMEKLPITRGYFVAVNLHGEMEDFIGQFRGHMLSGQVTDQQAIGRIQAFAAINEFTSTQDVWEKANALAKQLGIEAPTQRQRKKAGDQPVMLARAALFTNWINKLMTDPAVLREASLEIVADKAKSFEAFRRMTQAEKERKAQAIPRTGKAMRDKIIAMHLHEVLWAFGQGGSCPLVCGNCFDHPDPDTPGVVHRCASKPGSLFGRTKSGQLGATLHIGLH